MAEMIDLLAFSGLIAAQFLAAVAAYQYRNGFPAWQDSHPHGVTLIRRMA